MRITFVLPYADMSGGFRVIATYAQRLQDRGHTVTVVSTPPPPPTLRDAARIVVKERRWPVHKVGPSHLDHTTVNHVLLDRYRRVTEADVPDADVIVATWWETAEWVWALPKSKGAKAYFIQGYETWMGNVERVEATWRLPMQKIIISKWLMDLAVNKYGDEQAAHVPNSVDLNQFHAPPRGKQAVPTVGLLYSAHPCKGLKTSLKALEILLKSPPDSRGIQVISFGHHPPTAEMPLPPGAHFTAHPAQDRIKDLYASCDVWMCASRSEGFHLPPLEAMACRCPVVSTKVGGPMDIVEEGVNGHLVEIGDAEGLADRVRRVLTLEESPWRSMSDAAHASALRFSWEQATELFESALQKAIERQSREPALVG